ncbi:uncharacterized protein [Haliotis cracherodii]|uniref:uncharacterized protein isoform X2 n=1 Tax=Haliotis cracherodii TaxID=6455 RepID=UPI0039ED6D87
MGRRITKQSPQPVKTTDVIQRESTPESPCTPDRFDFSEVDSLLKTPPFDSRGGRTSPTWDEYHSLEYFDINPKTDYTYAHSGSHYPKYSGQPDIIPNMSRHRISSHASGYVLSQSGMETPPPYHQEERRVRVDRGVPEEQSGYREDVTYSEGRSRSSSYSRVTYRTDGMVLRSGSRLSGVGSYLERNGNNAMSSSASQSSSQSLARSLNSDFEVTERSEQLQHSTPLSHLYDKNSRESTDAASLGLSGIFSPRWTKTVVTTETIEYIDSEGRKRQRPAKSSQDEGEEVDSANTSGWFSGVRNLMGGSQTEETITQKERLKESLLEEEDVTDRELDEQKSKKGWFGMFQSSTTETTTEEEESRTQALAESDSDPQGRRKGRFGIFHSSETITEEEESRRRALAESDSDLQGRKGRFGMFRSSETVTEEEESRRQALAESDSDHKGHKKGWFGMFQRSETTEEEIRKQSLAAESDADVEESDSEEQPGWKNRFRNLLSKTTKEKWQTESVKESDVGEFRDDGSKKRWFDWKRTSLPENTDAEQSEPNHQSSNTGWFGWLGSRMENRQDNQNADSHGVEEDDQHPGWFGWNRISESTSTAETQDNKEDNSVAEDGSGSRAGWFSWTARPAASNDLQQPGDDDVDSSSKSRLFSWLSRSDEEKLKEDQNEKEGDESKRSGWFGWLGRSSTEETDFPEGSRNRKGGLRKARRRSKGHKVTFSLDSEEDTEGDVPVKPKRSSTSTLTSGSWTSRSSGSSYSSKLSDGKSWTWMQLLLTAITTISSFVSGLLSPVTNSYAYRQMKITIWRWLRIADMWVVSRSVGGCCCFCLPLLLLLPLLLGYMYGGELLEQARSSIKSFNLLQVNNTYTRPLPYVDPSTINIKIQQFFEEHRHKYETNQLTAADVEKIAQGLIAKELEDMKLALLQNINQVKADQTSSQTNQRTSFSSMDKKLGDFMKKYESLEAAIAALQSSGNVKVDGLKQDYDEQIRILQQQIKALGDDFSNLQLSHLELLASVRNCCRNDSFYALAVRQHVKDIFAQMMAGGAGGSGSDDGYGAFLHWLQSNYAKKEDMDKELAKVSEDITQRILTITKEQASNVYIQSDTKQGPAAAISEDYIRWIVDDALLKFSADQVGMADYALESAGGSVVSVRCSETYYRKTALVSVFGIPLWYTTNSARTVIQPDVHPGQCWAFKGARGFLVIQLAFPIKPSGFTLEHIPKALSPTGNIDSAPREFGVYGLSSETDKVGVSLGNYTYSDSGKPIQYFPIQATTGEFFSFVELKILGNHGNPEYTCLYRFRVHGLPYKDS